MHKRSSILLSLAALSCFVAGCAGPEEKLGRGFVNVTEFARGGEIRRRVEQTAIFATPEQAYTTGFIRGFDRSIVRTGMGAYEILTFPIANRAPKDYGPILVGRYPADPPYPDSYRPNWVADTLLQPDTALGFSGGDLAPMIPGSRFRIFDN
ncbi:MAG: exosortase system-associated protein, TIGR04073 family [Verrucomicrobiota bacterium]|jgi:putative exosortase-associated protein (TIGR04073 family)